VEKGTRYFKFLLQQSTAQEEGELIEAVWTEGPVLSTCLEEILACGTEEGLSEKRIQMMMMRTPTVTDSTSFK
jgi:flagellar biosynthesis/type III secretory pathway protein FliH